MRVSWGCVCHWLCLWRKEPYNLLTSLSSRPKTWEAFYYRVSILLEYPSAQQNKSRSLSLLLKLTVTPPFCRKRWVHVLPSWPGLHKETMESIKGKGWGGFYSAEASLFQGSDMSSGPLCLLHCLFLLKVTCTESCSRCARVCMLVLFMVTRTAVKIAPAVANGQVCVVFFTMWCIN